MSGAKKAKRLKVKEVSDILKHLRTYLPKNCIKEVGQLVWHINWLEEDRLSLEREIRELNQADLFEKQIAKETKEHDPEYSAPAPKVFTTPGERLWHMFKGGEEAIDVYFRTHNISPADRFLLSAEANQWAIYNGKEPVS